MKIGIAILSYRSTPVSLWPRFMMAESYCRAKGIQTEMMIYGHALVHRARNSAMTQLLELGCDYVVFVDDDMRLEANDIYRLVSQDKPVISGLLTTRDLPVHLTAKVWDESAGKFAQMDHCKMRITGKFATGAAFLAIRKDAAGILIDRYLRALDWMEDNRPALDRMHVRSEYRERERVRIERLRRALWESDREARIFEFPVLDSNHIQTGEDIALGLRLIQAGIDVTIDPEIAPRHVGEYGFGIADYEPVGDGTKVKPAELDELQALLKKAS